LAGVDSQALSSTVVGALGVGGVTSTAGAEAASALAVVVTGSEGGQGNVGECLYFKATKKNCKSGLLPGFHCHSWGVYIFGKGGDRASTRLPVPLLLLL